MRIAHVLALLGLGLALGAPVSLDDDHIVSISNCSSGGSSAQTLVDGRNYVLSVFDEETYVCFAVSASTCASGGVRIAMGTVLRITTNGDQKSVSCRSASSTGDIQLTPEP